MSNNSLTECAIENCTCFGRGICNFCRGLNIEDVPTTKPISSGTTLLGTDSFGYTVAQIALFVANNKPNDVITELSGNQNQVSNVDVYICTGTFTIELLPASKASRDLKIISLTGTVTVNSDSVTQGGTDNINGSTSTTVVAGEALVITPFSAGWTGYKVTQF
ncbi:MAG: hypothetical protein V3V84_07610 [Candidatus Bathyarchaeia archaeon]